MTPSDASAQSLKLTFLYVSDPSKVSSSQQKIVRSRATQHSHRTGTRKPKIRKSDSKDSNCKSSKCKQAGSSHAAVKSKKTINRRALALRAPTTSLYTGQVTKVRLEGGHKDPFSAFPVPEQPWFHWVLDYYRHIQLPPGIAVVQRSTEEGLRYIDWHLRESLTEPSLFYMQLLNACTPLLVEGRVKHEATIWLRGKVVSSLNEAVSSADRRNSLATLVTVSSIALHERLYGDAKMAVEVHGPAFRRMLVMQGGFQSLQAPRILLELLMWSDHVLAADNAQKTTADLLAAWAPASLRLQHPGYELPEEVRNL